MDLKIVGGKPKVDLEKSGVHSIKEMWNFAIGAVFDLS
jgi:hypothetical protein